MKKLKLFLAITDGQDGSFNISINQTKKEALEFLDRTEEQLEQGCFYEDGKIEEIILKLKEENGNLKVNESILITVGG